MKKANHIYGFILVVISIGSFIIGIHFAPYFARLVKSTLNRLNDTFAKAGQYDSFKKTKLLLTTDKKSYFIGDQITIISDIKATDSTKIRLYKDRTKSFRISLRRREGTGKDYADKDYYGKFTSASPNDAIEEISILKGESIRLTFKGEIIKEQKCLQKCYVFDFKKFGKFRKQNIGEFRIVGDWKTIKTNPSDSGEENYTNHLIIKVTRN